MNKRFTTFLLLNLALWTCMCSVKPNPVNIPQIKQVYDKDWFSGYLDFDFNGLPAHMHYFYFPSQTNHPQQDPLLFWFNGGPGCSSLLGAMYEHGPFIFNDAFGFLMNNPQSWNKRANTVYIQSPAQVGFSYMDIPEGKSPPEWDDDMVAKLNLKAVVQFYKVFDEFVGRPTYLSGESYGGIYVPTLANEIHEYNKNPTETFAINMKGFAVGNGCADVTECNFINDYPKYQMYLFRDLGYITQKQFQTVESLCQADKVSDECQKMYTQLYDRQDGFNIYDAFRPCWETTNSTMMPFKEMLRLALRIKRSKDDPLTWSPPCVDSVGIDKLLLDPNNRKSLGIPTKVPDYSMCNANQDFVYHRSTTGSYWVYRKLIPLNQYKIVIYSGDTDPAVPIAGTLMWINKIRAELSLSTRTYWRPWMTQTTNGLQNSGSIWTLSNKLTLFRFKGVGHMAPQWNNQGGTKLVNYFLFGENP